MVHKCLKCGAVYDDNDKRLVNGCPKCGSFFFAYIKEAKTVKEYKKLVEKTKKKDEDVTKELQEMAKKFGVETIRIPKDGVYEINVDALMKKEPLIVLVKQGTYFVYLPSVFEKFEKEKS